jgi:hypothetical protein
MGEVMSEQANRVEASSEEKRAQDSKASHTPALPHSHTPTLPFRNQL